MIEIKSKVDCCGCNACGDVCAHKAISFKEDIEGFWYPEVNRDLCTECGLCEKVCPILRVRSRKTGKGRARKGSFLLYRAKFPAFCQFSTNIYLRIVDICTCKRDALCAIIPIVHKGVVVPKTAARVGSLESSR